MESIPGNSQKKGVNKSGRDIINIEAL